MLCSEVLCGKMLFDGEECQLSSQKWFASLLTKAYLMLIGRTTPTYVRTYVGMYVL